jgi:phosphatidylethanolamine-binding protein (PEBP) family uncharacterized protein
MTKKGKRWLIKFIKNTVIIASCISMLGMLAACSSPAAVTTTMTTTVTKTVTGGGAGDSSAVEPFTIWIPADGASPRVDNMGDYPKDYTCGGTSSPPPMEWSGVPVGTHNLALIMWTVPPAPDPIKAYWVIYNIAPDVTSIAKNGADKIGVLGINEKSARAYEPPCSAGPGARNYKFTLFALTARPVLTVPPEKVDRDVLLAAMKDITLASTTLNVTNIWGNPSGGAAPAPAPAGGAPPPPAAK